MKDKLTVKALEKIQKELEKKTFLVFNYKNEIYHVPQRYLLQKRWLKK